MIYQSLKQTIAEYDQKLHSAQTSQEKLIFPWKVISLFLCIAIIIFVGTLSQLLRDNGQGEVLKYNASFLPYLLEQSLTIQKMKEINTLMYGINASTRVRFQNAKSIFYNTQLNSTSLLDSIHNNENLLYVLQLTNQDKTQKYKFGMLLKSKFDFDIDSHQANQIYVYDPEDDQTSVLFNLQSKQALRLDLDPSCKLYSYNQTSKNMILSQFLHISSQNSKQVQIRMQKMSCFGQNIQQAMAKILKVTGITVSADNQPITLNFEQIQVFQLYKTGELEQQF